MPLENLNEEVHALCVCACVSERDQTAPRHPPCEERPSWTLIPAPWIALLLRLYQSLVKDSLEVSGTAIFPAGGQLHKIPAQPFGGCYCNTRAPVRGLIASQLPVLASP